MICGASDLWWQEVGLPSRTAEFSLASFVKNGAMTQIFDEILSTVLICIASFKEQRRCILCGVVILTLVSCFWCRKHPQMKENPGGIFYLRLVHWGKEEKAQAGSTMLWILWRVMEAYEDRSAVLNCSTMVSVLMNTSWELIAHPRDQPSRFMQDKCFSESVINF